MFNIIIKRLITNVNDSIMNIDENLQNLKEPNIIKKIDNIPKISQLKIIFFFVILVFILKSIKITYNFIVSIIFSLFIIYIYLIYKNNNIIKYSNKIGKMVDDLSEVILLNKNTRHYTSNYDIKILLNHEDIIFFYYNNLFFYKANSKNYANSLYNTLNLIKLLEDINKGIKNSYQNLEVAVMYYKNAINDYESIIHSIENISSTSNEGKKFLNSVKELRKTLLVKIEKIKNLIILNNDNKEININTEPNSIIQSLSIVGKNDTQSKNYMPNFNYF